MFAQSSSEDQKIATVKAQLIKQIQALKSTTDQVEPPKPQKVIDLQAEIESYRKLIAKQQQQLSQPLPKVNPSLLYKLQSLKIQYAQVARSKLQLVRNHVIDKYDSNYLKEFDKLDYINKAYFPLIYDKPSAVLGFSQQCPFQYDFDQYTKILGDNDRLREQINSLQAVIDDLQNRL